MFQKTIRIRTKPGMHDEFMRRQQMWNEEMAKQPGFVSVFVGVHFDQKDWVQVSIAFDSPESLELFMTEKHDAVFAATQIQETMESIEVEYFDVFQSVDLTTVDSQE